MILSDKNLEIHFVFLKDFVFRDCKFSYFSNKYCVKLRWKSF